MKQKIKITKIDILLIILILFFIWLFFYRVNKYLNYQWQWKSIFQYFFVVEDGKIGANVLSIGILNTIKISVYSIILSTIIGFIMGIFKSTKNLFFRLIGVMYVESIRNIPSIVVIFVVYYFLGDQIITVLKLDNFFITLDDKYNILLNFFLVPKDKISIFLIGIIALSLYEGAYITEIVRGAIKSIDKGQIDASKSLGLNKWQRLRYIVFPQALPLIIPPLTGQMVSTIKDSAILSVISIPELTFQGMELMASTYLIFETWIIITVIYLVLNIILSHVSGYLEMRLKSYRT
ncbi:amino acid ABC transporter permease [Deferribacter autotrophicus]|uniref:Amino acid ABC transporter permease n=1 Tax=Deferribacter autotrophicus TaxID=500465 RepID=A0A5A8F162_9BACT|nr:amino acid ABC transporter permease [Deferribacter autotrophicus]KAA0257399.1 amino acid ABC transporter permease [Deferribacter autotrophicus]